MNPQCATCFGGEPLDLPTSAGGSYRICWACGGDFDRPHEPTLRWLAAQR